VLKAEGTPAREALNPLGVGKSDTPAGVGKRDTPAEPRAR
jgi:hypothetical protein